jgi:chromosome segregation ATPase
MNLDLPTVVATHSTLAGVAAWGLVNWYKTRASLQKSKMEAEARERDKIEARVDTGQHKAFGAMEVMLAHMGERLDACDKRHEACEKRANEQAQEFRDELAKRDEKIEKLRIQVNLYEETESAREATFSAMQRELDACEAGRKLQDTKIADTEARISAVTVELQDLRRQALR